MSNFGSYKALKPCSVKKSQKIKTLQGFENLAG